MTLNLGWWRFLLLLLPEPRTVLLLQVVSPQRLFVGVKGVVVYGDEPSDDILLAQDKDAVGVVFIDIMILRLCENDDDVEEMDAVDDVDEDGIPATAAADVVLAFMVGKIVRR